MTSIRGVTQKMDEKMETKAAPEKVAVKAKTFVCANCGGVIKFDIDSQKFRCASCKTESAIETLSEQVREYDFSGYLAREKASVAFEGVAVIHCQNCGCEITFEAAQIAATCPMCGSSQVATVKQSAGIPPEGIIPFTVDKDEAALQFKKWVKSRWFAPGDFKKKCSGGALKGMFLPFWTYDAKSIADYTGRGGHTRTEKDKDGNVRTVTDWFPVSGIVTEDFDDVLVCASGKGKALNGILPYKTVTDTKPYSPSYLSGFYAELYTVKADAGFETAKGIMQDSLRAAARQEILSRFDSAEVSNLDAKYTDVTYKHLLLPVWGSAYGYKGKAYNYFVNGETGKVDGQRPYSVPKIVAAVLVTLAVAAGVALLLHFSHGPQKPADIPAAVLTQETQVFMFTADHM